MVSIGAIGAIPEDELVVYFRCHFAGSFSSMSAPSNVTCGSMLNQAGRLAV